MEIFNVTPVQLVADWDVLRLFEIEPGRISIEHQHNLIGRLAPLFTERGMVLSFYSDMEWRLQLSKGGAVKTTPLHCVAGANLHDFMPRGEDAMLWRELLNEAQMVLHAAGAESRQQEISILPKFEGANGIWIWRDQSGLEKVMELGKILFARRAFRL